MAENGGNDGTFEFQSPFLSDSTIVDAPIVSVSSIGSHKATPSRLSTSVAPMRPISVASPVDMSGYRASVHSVPGGHRPSAASNASHYRPSIDTHPVSDEELARRLQDEEVADHVASTQVLPGDVKKQPNAFIRQVSSFAAWQLDKEQYGFCLGESKYAKFCWLMILLCTIMFIIEMSYADWQFESIDVNPAVGPSVAVLLELGAKRTDLIVQGHQYYRLIMPVFLHAGVIHIVFNMIALANIGIPLEHDYGTLKIAYIYITSGLMGEIVSCIFLPYTVGVGASGAIFGLFGAAWADLIQNWALYKEQKLARRMVCQLTFATVVNLALGLLPFLDNFAHLGGLANGVITGLTVLIQDRFNRFGELKQKKSYQCCLQVFSMALTPVS
jgi:membrane associated rhomboid family serine protease